VPFTLQSPIAHAFSVVGCVTTACAHCASGGRNNGSASWEAPPASKRRLPLRITSPSTTIFALAASSAAWRVSSTGLLDISHYIALVWRAAAAKLHAIFFADRPVPADNIKYAARFRRSRLCGCRQSPSGPSASD
jgi:hypothetical protein